MAGGMYTGPKHNYGIPTNKLSLDEHATSLLSLSSASAKSKKPPTPSANTKKKGQQQGSANQGGVKAKAKGDQHAPSTPQTCDPEPASSSDEQNPSPPIFDPETGQLDETKSHTVQSLSDTLQLLQNGIQDAIVSKALDDEKYIQTEAKLNKELENITVEFHHIKDLNRTEARDQFKNAEKLRVSLDDRKAKSQIIYQKLRDSIVRKNQQMDQWKSEMEEADKKLESSRQHISQLVKKHDSNTETIRHNVDTITEEVSSLEKDIKALNAELKKVQAFKASTLEAIEEVKKNVDDTGQIDKDVVEKILDQSNLQQSFKDVISEEASLEGKLEKKWREDQKNLENRYVLVHSQYETTNKAYQNALAALNTFLQSPYPSPSNQSSDNNSQPLKSVSGSSKSKRKNRSRRNTKSSGSFSRGSNDPSNANGSTNSGFGSFSDSNASGNNGAPSTVAFGADAPLNISYPFSNQGNPNISHPVAMPNLHPLLQHNLNDLSSSHLLPSDSNSNLLSTLGNVPLQSSISQPIQSAQDGSLSAVPVTTSQTPSKTLKLTIPLSTDFPGISGGVAEIQSPSNLVPSYIISGEDDVRNTQSQQKKPDQEALLPSSIIPMASSKSSQSLTSFAARPSASILSTMNRHRSGSSDSLSPRISLGSVGAGNEFVDVPSDGTGANILHRRSSFTHLFNNHNLQATISSSGSIHSFNDALYYRNKIYQDDGFPEGSGEYSHESEEKAQGKGGSMFSSIFSTLRPKQARKSIGHGSLNQASSLSDMTSFGSSPSIIISSDDNQNGDILRPLGHSSSNSTNAANMAASPLLMNRVRSGSVNSSKSLQVSLGEPFGAANYSPWKTSSIAIDSQSSLIRNSPSIAHSSLANTELAGSASSSFLNHNGFSDSHSTSVWTNIPQSNSSLHLSQSFNNTSQGLGAIGAISAPAVAASANIWKESANESENQSPESRKSSDYSDKNVDLPLQSPSSNSNKSRFSRGFSGLFNISGSHRESSKLQNEISGDDSTTLSADANPLLLAPALNESQDQLSIGSNGGDTSIKTSSSSSSLSPNPPLPLQQPSPQPPHHKGGLLQKGIRTFSLSKRSVSSTSGFMGAHKDKDDSDKEKDADTDIEKEKPKEKKKKNKKKDKEVEKKEKEADAENEGLPGIEEDPSNQPVSAGSKFAKRLSIFGGGSKKDKDAVGEDEKPTIKEGVDAKDSKPQDAGVEEDGEKSFFARLGGGKKDDEVQYQHLFDKIRK